ncbi:MAG: hypothetical protein MJE77_00935 [Proteobacteria bacterium]|nr:hypothetical protein [Pseudomonadota bacterium]
MPGRRLLRVPGREDCSRYPLSHPDQVWVILLAVDFDWMEAAHLSAREDVRLDMYRREVSQRAALFCRLGYSVEHAIARLQANADWDFELGSPRPAELSSDAIAEIARAAYARGSAH